jgi:predicted DNA-binding protein (UPF0251 family)
VTGVPTATYFKPQGIPLRDLAELRLPIEGLEALRLADLEGLTTEAAAAGMGVSRHTFGRVLAEAREVVAKALVTGAALRIGGGHYGMADNAGAASATAGEHETTGSQARTMSQGLGSQQEDATMRQTNGSFQGRGGGGGRCGRGQGQGQGRGMGQGQGGRGGGQGRGMGGQAGRGGVRADGIGAGQVGTDLCLCPQCGQTAPHVPGSPCTVMTCPACGAAMIRQQP